MIKNKIKSASLFDNIKRWIMNASWMYGMGGWLPPFTLFRLFIFQSKEKMPI